MKEFEISQPLVSVIMPTYNQSEFISKAVESVLGQTYKDFELIMIDNYSEDNTEEIVASYASKDSRIVYKKFSNNGVIAKSRNIGIKMSQGEFLAFLDSDDSWLDNKLEKVMGFFNKFSDVDMVCHDEYHVNLNNNNIKHVRYGSSTNYRDLLFKGNTFSTSAVVVRRCKVIEAGLFSENENFVTAEDYELWMRLSMISKVAFFHEVLGKFNIHEKSSSKKIEKHMSSALSVVNHHFKQFKPHTLFYRYLINKRKGAIYRYTSNLSIKVGDKGLALKTIKAALRLNPLSLKTWISFIVIMSVFLRNFLFKNI